MWTKERRFGKINVETVGVKTLRYMFPASVKFFKLTSVKITVHAFWFWEYVLSFYDKIRTVTSVCVTRVLSRIFLNPLLRV